MPKRDLPAQRGTPRTRQGAEPKERSARAASRRNEESEGTASDFRLQLIGRYGSIEAAFTQVTEEQLKLRRRAQDAEARVEELEDQLPEDGYVSISADDAKLLEALKAGNRDIKPDGVSGLFSELATLRSDKVTAERDKNLRDSVGKKYNLDTLSKLLGTTTIEFQKINVMKEDKSGIEEVQSPFVVLKNADNTVTKESLDSYVQRTFKDFMPVLLLEDGDGEDSEDSETTTDITPRMPRQTTISGNTARKGGAADMLKAVDTAAGGYMTPSQRRKAAGA